MITIKELAAQTGLSVSTVSLVLRGEAQMRKISQRTQDLVWQAAREHNYQPNIAARRLRRRDDEMFTVAFFWTSDYRARQMVRFLRGLQSAVQHSGRNIEIIIHPFQSDALYKERSLMDMNMFHAAIISTASQKDMEFLESNSFHMPIVLGNRCSEKFCTAYVDEPKIGVIAAETFFRQGYRRAAVLTTTSNISYRLPLREEGFARACKALGLPLVKRLYADNSIEGGYQSALELTRMSELPDCLFCTADTLSYGALRAFYQAGVRIPDDLKIITVDNMSVDFNKYAYVSLSAVYFPLEEMAGACLNLLLDLADGKIQPPHALEIPVHYRPRESCPEIGNAMFLDTSIIRGV